MSKKIYIETYGCQMNVGDSEVIFSILGKEGYERTESMDDADVILANTCSVRDNAEQRIWGRIEVFHKQKEKRGAAPHVGKTCSPANNSATVSRRRISNTRSPSTITSTARGRVL